MLHALWFGRLCLQAVGPVTALYWQDSHVPLSRPWGFLFYASFALIQRSRKPVCSELPWSVMQAVVPLASKAPPQLKPTKLTPDLQRSLRLDAVQRILANANTPSQETRIALLSRLATKTSAADSIGEEILQHILKDYHANNGHQLAVSWLFVLYKELALSPNGLANGQPAVQAQLSGAAQDSARAELSEAGADVSGALSADMVKKTEDAGEAGPSAMDTDEQSGK